MSWLLFLDESGHDHRNMPYEVRGGVAIHASRLWPFVKDIQALEQLHFGCRLQSVGSEIKGEKLLRKDRFKWAAQGTLVNPMMRTRHALNFLNSKGRSPRSEEFCAFGQACLAFVRDAFSRLDSFDAYIFAAIIPPIPKPRDARMDLLRKDHVFLLERYAYFLQERNETGLIVMDESEKSNDQQFVSQMERYFTRTQRGLERADWIVPSVFFVESDMAYGVQLADVVVYCLNWAFQTTAMTKHKRDELDPLVKTIMPRVWRGKGKREASEFESKGVVFVPDPYENR